MRYKKGCHHPKTLKLNSITTNIDANDIRNNPSILDFDHLEKERKARFQTKEKSNNDTTLSEDEKIIKFKQYEDKGYYTHSQIWGPPGPFCSPFGYEEVLEPSI